MQSCLQYGKITLRPPEPDDVDILYKWENDMELWEISNTRAPFSKYILSEYIKNSFKDIYETKQLRFIIENDENNPVGAIDLYNFDPYHQRAGVGVLVHSIKDRKRGLASDALEALKAYATEILGLKQLFANVGEDNTVSIRLFEKAGFERAGIKKAWLKTALGWKNEILYQKILK
jgi:diamine N-acetyltransferase